MHKIKLTILTISNLSIQFGGVITATLFCNHHYHAFLVELKFYTC